MKLEPGKHAAQIKSYGVGKPQGTATRPPIFVEFEIQDHESGEVGSIYWWGQMTDKSRPESKRHPYEITIDNLLLMGLKGSDPYAVAENAPGALNTFRPYELVLENNTYNGKTTLRVKYINLPGSGGVKEALSHQEAKAMAGFNFAGAVMAAREVTKIKDEPAPVENKPAERMPDADIPF